MIVLDTHTWLWWIRGDAPELPQAMRDLISNSPDPIAVASVSCLEVAWLSKKGRVALPVPIDEFFLKAIDGAGLLLLPLTVARSLGAARGLITQSLPGEAMSGSQRGLPWSCSRSPTPILAGA